MKVAFATSGDGLGAPLASRFGRAASFLVYDMERGNFELIDNRSGLEAPQGAGIQAAQTIVGSGADSLVSGHCGPNAFRILSASGVMIYISDAATVAEALEQLRSGRLTPVRSADVEGHRP